MQPDPLLNAFYVALRNRAFDEMQHIISQLTAHVQQDSTYPAWATYFSGILAEERDRNWASAEKIYLKVLQSEIPVILRAHVLLSLGVAYSNQARWPESLRVCEESAALWRTLGYKIKEAYVSRQIAIALRRGFHFGEFDATVLPKAALLCQQALNTFASYDPSSAENVLYTVDIPLYQAITLHVLGNIYLDAGELALSLTCFQQMLDISSERNDPYLKAFALRELADVNLRIGAQLSSDLLQMYEESLNLFRQTRDKYAEFEVLAALGNAYKVSDQFDQALHYYQQSLTMLEVVRAGVTSEVARMGFFTTVTNIYYNTILTWLVGHDWENAFNSVERARSRALLDSLTSGMTDYLPNLDTETLTLSQIQAYLPADAVILEYFTISEIGPYRRPNPAQRDLSRKLFPTAATLLFALTNDTIQFYDLGVSPDILLTSTQEPLLAPHVRQILYEKCLTPAEAIMQGKRRLYIIPHGPLHAIPFHALIASDGDTLLREDGPEIVYAPSATILFRERQRQGPPAAGSCLAVGYNGDEGLELHFAEEEAAYIARMAQGVALVGPTPKKAALYAQAPNYRALHFSCHGEFDPDAPLQSLLHIGPDETLTGQEIMDNLRLNCNLVTLSACESGLSKVQRGDELYGLIRAFMYAGAPAIIATLWQVDERSTLIFAEKFYALLQQGLPYATALKAAQLYLRQLTRKEARLILSQHIAQQAFGGEISPLRQADQYLKSFAPQPLLAADPLSNPLLYSEDDEEAIFADPKFWAPFVLIGDPQIGRA